MRRYIDADKLIDDIRPFAGYDSNRSNKDWARRFEIAIGAQPTADVRENVRGEWIDAKYPFSKCSICGCYFDTANNEAKFCPNCGADMRGDEENAECI